MIDADHRGHPERVNAHHLAFVMRHADTCQQAAILQQQDVADTLPVLLDQRQQGVVGGRPGFAEGLLLKGFDTGPVGCLQGLQPGIEQMLGGLRQGLFEVIPALRAALRDIVVDGLGIGGDRLLPLLLLGVLLVHERIGLLFAYAFAQSAHVTPSARLAVVSPPA
ncbi:hypothetical protein PPS11_31151 [Pseudomonas putida S11]|nr:hypothetical protein PPS11_31151 [Pseudomonas putida S11]